MKKQSKSPYDRMADAAVAAHYLPSDDKPACWRANRSNGSGNSGLKKGQYGVWGYTDNGGPEELLGWGWSEAAALNNAAKRLEEQVAADALESEE